MTDRSEHAVLNHLIETCRDAERGFRQAAAHVAAPELRTLFTELAVQRATFARELLPHAQRLGGNGAAAGTAVGSLHRALVALEAAIGLGDRAIVHEVERGDRESRRIYFDAVNGTLPPQSRDLVERQFQELEDTHARLAGVRAS